MTFIKTKETKYCIYNWCFIEIPYLNNQFNVCKNVYTGKALGITKLEIAYDTAQDNSK